MIEIMHIELIKRLTPDNTDAKNILVIGVFHGDEEQGELLINKYLEDIYTTCSDSKSALAGDKNISTGNGLKNNIYYIPRLNSSNKRTNPNGVDLNRNFPTKNWGEDTSAAGENPGDYYGGSAPASEEETKFIIALMNKVNFDAIITLHSPYKIVNYDGGRGGEALKLADTVSKITGYPVQKDIGYPTPGSFGTYAGIERDIPTITVEMDENTPLEKLYPKFKVLFEYLECKY